MKTETWIKRYDSMDFYKHLLYTSQSNSEDTRFFKSKAYKDNEVEIGKKRRFWS